MGSLINESLVKRYWSDKDTAFLYYPPTGELMVFTCASRYFVKPQKSINNCTKDEMEKIIDALVDASAAMKEQFKKEL